MKLSLFQYYNCNRVKIKTKDQKEFVGKVDNIEITDEERNGREVEVETITIRPESGEFEGKPVDFEEPDIQTIEILG